MGKIKEIAQNSKSTEFTSNSTNIKSRAAGEVVDSFKSVTNGQSLTTSTQADKGESESDNHTTQEIFAQAEKRRQERFKNEPSSEDVSEDETVKNSENIEKTKKDTEFIEQSEKAEEKISAENRKNEELQEDIDQAQQKKAIKEKAVAEQEQEEQQDEQEDDKFNKRDRSLKESSEVKGESENLDKINSKEDKLNQENSLQKVRGGEEAVKEGTKEEAKKGIASSGASKISTGLLAAQVIKTASSAFNVDYSKRRSSEATESSGMLILIIAAAAMLILSPLFLILIPIMGGAGGRQAYDQTSSQSSGATAEEIILWDTLMEHFDDNETAVLGIMCNVYYESGFKPNNLEDTNNTVWGISDEEYTAAVNDGTLTREQFSKDMWGNSCRGHGTQYGWVNPDGGYGYCQFTSFDKKDDLYQYATDYYDYGIGEGQEWDIGDATMQANYICYLLDNTYTDLDAQLRAATSVADATYVWTAGYEKPGGNWRDIADFRSMMADTIKTACESGVVGGGTATSVTEEELSATHVHYNQYDPRWGNLPYRYSSGGSNTITNSGCGPTSLAMVVTELTRDSSNPVVLTPDVACEYSANHGCHLSSGTAHALFQSPLTDSYGVNGAEIAIDEATMKSYLDSGCLLIITVGQGAYTGGGHCMTIDEYDSTGFLINDPNYSATKNYRVDYTYLISTNGGHLEHVFALWLAE